MTCPGSKTRYFWMFLHRIAPSTSTYNPMPTFGLLAYCKAFFQEFPGVDLINRNHLFVTSAPACSEKTSDRSNRNTQKHQQLTPSITRFQSFQAQPHHASMGWALVPSPVPGAQAATKRTPCVQFILCHRFHRFHHSNLNILKAS